MTVPAFPNEYEAKLETQLQTASDIFRSIALLVGHPMPEGDVDINLRELYDSVARFNRLYTAHVDEIPSLSTTPHEIADEVTAEEVVEMWHALKMHCEGVKAQVSGLTEENDKLRALLAKGKGPCIYCQLPAEDIAKCQHGFPGCGRMDDLATEINSVIESQREARILDLMEERDGLKAALSVRKAPVHPYGPRYPSVDEIIENRKKQHTFVPLPKWAETDRTDEPCLVCINSKDDPIHANSTPQWL